MRLAIDAAESVRGRTYPNPPVGAVIVDPDGSVVGIGATQPTGGPHAEVIALQQAGDKARGATAFVTLEPCNHYGRTPPCTKALIDAEISAVHFAIADPNPAAAGGSEALERAGIRTEQGLMADQVAQGPLRAWLFKQKHARPHITWKYAASLDGRSAARDGSSQWITGPEARAHVHAERAKLDAIIVGTGTVEADNPWLTARLSDGNLAPNQPTRVVVGRTEIPASARVLDDAAPTLLVRTHDPREVVAALADHTDVLLEGGPTLAGAFLQARLIDRIVAYIAPVVLGAGQSALGDVGVGNIGEALRFRREYIEPIGTDVMLSLVPEE
ncbi:bifunctional diaminohydroxyphosphoribosylaminopyrimidine deaminase/5-amino-6-(5-phosphoribosylamino)uracil reductase RibD [Antrihabitans sp. YC2-6]|uniref:bifunctional diaminohydroxyphosphoribosylaminopyrimidine deaminase/5-amino-6-(5-phosphoribosylamino)uracil reductase RibD n=1 Tax=Antrihabitans sp. YC2-6 TaxID=2799498 RepID=UPI0018F346C7|nr:bifunctional diaminohydroxyphosphoribosylaminopyrimidine deaminase/5-amino-6-(5-phosphoribosylamino)uracil reductase RibD [Antrihabitans sp. YC2-6]MBJ8345328.1 bifunctional diaminohydroxyphosphoribosylaminopyrimidine deaminase/5-amino-6-(5-phosphoribosylamino)uracil reductase RibD [Antrihabitans sp. YC2-6]